jgi:hypothetical protein
MYLNGDNPFAVSEQSILVGRSRPEVTVDVDRRLFTPNGDGDRDSIAISQSSSEQDLWTGTFTNADDEVVRTITWDGSVEDFIWDGKDDAGEVLPDGFYTYTVSSQNEYGNIGSAALVNLRIDNLSATISIVADQEVFSPNGDDYRDFVTLLPSVAIPENLRAWEIRLEREDGLIRKTFQGGSNLPEQVIWEGENDARTVEDGEYSVTFFVEYKNGNYTQREADETVILVTNPPQGFVNIDDVLFSPDGDGVNDSLTIGLDARAADRPITGWNVEILDPFGNSFRSWGGDGLPPENLTWDGLSDSGELGSVRRGLHRGIHPRGQSEEHRYRHGHSAHRHSGDSRRRSAQDQRAEHLFRRIYLRSVRCEPGRAAAEFRDPAAPGQHPQQVRRVFHRHRGSCGAAAQRRRGGSRAERGAGALEPEAGRRGPTGAGDSRRRLGADEYPGHRRCRSGGPPQRSRQSLEEPTGRVHSRTIVSTTAASRFSGRPFFGG